MRSLGGLCTDWFWLQVSLPTQYNSLNQDPVGALSSTFARLQSSKPLRELRGNALKFHTVFECKVYENACEHMYNFHITIQLKANAVTGLHTCTRVCKGHNKANACTCPRGYCKS